MTIPVGVRGAVAGAPGGLALAGAAPAGDAGRERARAEAAGLVVGVVPQRGIGHLETGRMADAGIGSLRFWLSWPSVEPERGHYDWSGPDQIVESAAASGIATLPYLYGSPGWAIALDGYDCEVKCGAYAPASALTRGAFASFAGAAVRRYGPEGSFWRAHPALPHLPIRAWQVWNEQNSPFFFRPRADASSYAALLERTATAVRAVDPGAEVIVGGMWGATSSPSGVIGTGRYLRDLYRVDGASESFDSISVHPYDPRTKGVLAQIRAARRVARRAGDAAAGLWVTEVGWASAGRRNEGLVKGRSGQARMLRRTFTRLIDRAERWNLRGAYWYAWRDTVRGGAVCAWCARAGLLTRGGRAKPAYRALRTLVGPG
ncbi:MAG: hypothetical protein GEU88_08615 [Solirubrobacterales bacterium]|nr:hypothetical protein [Solirubrobacterales bacterium]